MMRGYSLLLPALLAVVLSGCGKSTEAPNPDSTATPAPATPAEAAAPGCPYLPEFVSLQAELPKLSAAEAAERLDQYAANYSNPEGCEGTELDRLLNGAESQLFYLAFGDTRHNAQLTLRCDEWDARTTRCTGPVEDGTAHAMSMGTTALALPASPSVRVETEVKSAKLLGVYVVSLADALDGRPAQRLSGEPKFDFPTGSKDIAVVAIFQTEGVWRYRKAVWYF